MHVRYLISNIRRPGLGQSGMISKPAPIPPGVPVFSSLFLDTPPTPPAPSLEPKPLEVQAPGRPNPGAPSEMIQPAKVPVINQPPRLPPASEGPQPRWVNEGKNDLTRTLLATGMVAVLATAFALFK